MLSGTAEKFLRRGCGFLLVCASVMAQQREDGRAFLRGRVPSSITKLNSADALAKARVRRMQMPLIQPAASLSTTWTPLGPSQVITAAYGKVTGRVTSVAIDPSDLTGNTVFVGTTGGGVWKSTNAAASAADVIFTPLTDTLPVFSANAGGSVIPSLSIGAVSVRPGGGVVLAGTGDPNDASDSYYGEGILRSTDGGATWGLIQQSSESQRAHSFLGQGIAGFAWSTLAPDVVVVAVSEAKDATITGAGAAGTSARGLYYSTDAGATWKMATLMDGAQTIQSQSTSFTSFAGNAVTSVVWNPVRHKFYAAVRYHGYYESSDGQTWTRMATQPGAGFTTANCPANAGAPGAQSCPLFRGALAVQPTTGDLFAFTVDLNHVDQGIWQDVCALSGSSCSNTSVQWTKQLPSSALESSGYISQGDYNLTLAAVPSGADTILFAGTTEIFRCSINSGCTFRNTTNATTGCVAGAKVAPAQHAIAWLGSTIFFGNDGGLWRSADLVAQTGASCSADDAAHFDNLNGSLGSLAQVHALSSDPSNADIMLAGLGALGSASTTTASTTDVWTQMGTGESANVVIDRADPQHWYVQSGGGVAVVGCAKGSACTATDFATLAQIGSTQVSGDDALDDAPFLLDPMLHTNLLAGTCRIWRGSADDGSLWSTSNVISAALAGPTGVPCGGANSFIRSLAAGGPLATSGASQNSGSTVIYAGMAGLQDGGGAYGGHLYSTSAADTATGATVWADLTANSVTNDVSLNYRFNPGNYDISSIAVDPHDVTGKTVYATVMGFGVPHLYRSTDGGASWLNVTRNLPDVPANAVVVDPNDANTVYLATDAGIFVTTAIASCGTADCWSVYGTGLPNAPVVALEVQAALHDGLLRAGTYGRGIWQIPLLTAGAPLQPSISLSPLSLTFATVQIGSSTSQTITATNTGSGVFNATRVETTGDFSATTDCTSSPVLSSGSCTLTVTFAPTAAGARSGTVVLYGNVPSGAVSAPLSGTGAGTSAINTGTTSLSFVDTIVNASSPAQTVTVNNTGTADGTLASITTTGDFKISADTCGTTLAASQSCSVSITFTPSTSGLRTGLLTVTSNTGTSQVALSGKGLLSATDTLTPASLTFASTLVNTVSAAQSITLKNDGDVALSLVAAKIISGDFGVVNGCGTSLLSHSSCTMQVTFSPQSIGAHTGVLQVSDELGAQTVTLNGTGLAPAGVSLTPSSLTFGATGTGLASAPQTITLANNGGSPLTLTSLAVSGDFGIVAGSNTCSTTASISVGSSCSLQIAFVPVSAGTRTGALIISSNAPSSPQQVSFSGTGVGFTLTASGTTSQTVKSGASAAYPLLLTPDVPMAQSVTLSCSGAPKYAKCTVAPSAADLSGTTTLTVTLQTGTNSAKTRPMLAMGFGLTALLAWTQRKRRFPALFVLLFCIATIGCGEGRKLPDGYDGGGGGGGSGGGSGGDTYPTPSGTYPITVTASAAGLTKSVTLTLIVQ